MNIFKVQDHVNDFYNSNFVAGKGLIIPSELKPYKLLLIALLSFAKVFTNAKTDNLIDEIIEALNLLN